MVDFDQWRVSTILILTTVCARLHWRIELASRPWKMRQSSSFTIAMADICQIISSHSAIAVLFTDQVVPMSDSRRVLLCSPNSSLPIFQPFQPQVSELLRPPKRPVVNHLVSIIILKHIFVFAEIFFMLICLNTRKLKQGTRLNQVKILYGISLSILSLKATVNSLGTTARPIPDIDVIPVNIYRLGLQNKRCILWNARLLGCSLTTVHLHKFCRVCPLSPSIHLSVFVLSTGLLKNTQGLPKLILKRHRSARSSSLSLLPAVPITAALLLHHEWVYCRGAGLLDCCLRR